MGTPQVVGRVQRLGLTPLKGAAHVHPERVELDRRGPVGDRGWCLLERDDAGTWVVARTVRTPAVLLLAVVVLALGWPVRRWNRGHRDRRLDPLRAARTAVLGQASALAGAALLGWYLGQVLHLLPDVALPLPRQSVTSLLVAAAASALLLVAGLVVERWCRLPEDDDDEPPGGLAQPHG